MIDDCVDIGIRHGLSPDNILELLSDTLSEFDTNLINTSRDQSSTVK